MMSFDARAVALQLAGAHPDQELSCPICAAGVKGKNLDRHLRKVHPGAGPPPSRWRGRDRIVVLPLGLTALLVGPALTLVAFELFGPRTAPAYLAVAVDLLLFVLFALAVFGRFTADLAIAGDELILRWGFGLGCRRLRVPIESLEIGSLVIRRSSATTGGARYNSPGYDQRFGTYLRLRGQPQTITVGCRSYGGLAKRWAAEGWTKGGKRRRWDITVAPEVMVALEYWLVRVGRLRPKL